MKIYHNSHNIQFRKPFGAVKCGQEIKLLVDAFEMDKTAEVYVVLDIEGTDHIRFKMNSNINDNENTYSCSITAPDLPGLLWYFFEMNLNGQTTYYGNNNSGLGGPGEMNTVTPKPYQITVYPIDYHTPDWFKGTLVYQIFVDRFFNGNDDGKINNPKKNSFLYANWNDTPFYIRQGKDIARWEFFGGNLLGIIKKLDYLKKLGVGAIYLNPIFEARSNHKYDTANYKKIDPMFGDNELFKKLCYEAEKIGIAIILDGVFSHTGADSIYFNKFGTYDSIGAFQSEDSDYYHWYKFERYPNKIECWWGVEDLPNVNELEPSYMDYIINDQDSVINYWMSLGCKGWRLDVADELPDEFIGKLRNTARKKDREALIIGEVWEDASNKISYGGRRKYLYGGLLDSATNYPLRGAVIDYVMGKTQAEDISALVMSLYENYPKEAFYSMLNIIGGHDVPRILSVMTGTKASSYKETDTNLLNTAVRRLKLAVLIQMIIPGSPSIYYGDEAGAMGFDEPQNRGTYPWGLENLEILNWYKNITEIRAKFQCLKTGSWKVVFAKSGTLALIRYITGNADEFGKHAQNEAVIAVINSSMENVKGLELDLTAFGINELTDMFLKSSIIVNKGILPIDIEGFGYRLLYCEL